VQQRYRKFVLATYRYLRHPNKRKHPVLGWISHRVFDRHLWSWHKKEVLGGVGWGLAAAILPVPAQTIFSTLFCIWRRANVPMGALMCWLSPPGCFVVVIPAQWYIGQQILHFCNLPSSPLTIESVKAAIVAMETQQQSLGWWQSLQHSWTQLTSGVSFWQLISEFSLGLVVSCSLLGLLGWLLGLLIWNACVAVKRLYKQH